MESGRKIKTTPFHCRLDDAGASWGCISGWERPNWFSEPADGENVIILAQSSVFKLGCRENSCTFGRPNYFKFMQKEHLACREKVALFDLSPFVKLVIEVSLTSNIASVWISMC